MERWQKVGIGLTLVLLLIQMGVWFPSTQTLNSVEDPIQVEVDFTVEPILGQTDDEGRIKVTFHCQATLTMNGNPNVEWFLIEGRSEMASLVGGDAADPCGDTWYLEPGTYTLKTFKTDGIRYDQSIEIHSFEEAVGHFRMGAFILCLFVAFWPKSDD